MGRTKFVWNYAAAGDLMLRSQAIADVCAAEAEKMTRAAGVRYRANVHQGRTRVNAGARHRVEDIPESAQLPEVAQGKLVNGYRRKGKDGKEVWVKAYRRKK